MKETRLKVSYLIRSAVFENKQRTKDDRSHWQSVLVDVIFKLYITNLQHP